MSDRISGGRSRTRTVRRLGWLGALMLLAGALLIPGTAASAASPTEKCGCHTTTTTDSTSTTETTQTTETSSVSETTETTQTSSTSTTETTATTTTDGTTTTETGGVGGETGTPEVTPPPTSSLAGTSGSSDGWRVILLVLAGIAVLSLVLVPSGRQSSKR